MAAAVKHVRKRGDVYQYERRVPLEVRRDPHRFAVMFDAKPLFRRSLKTSADAEMHRAAALVHEEFERRIKPLAEPPGEVNLPQNTRIVTGDDLEAIAGRYSDVVAGPMERLYNRANVDPVAATELARLEYEFERAAEEIQFDLRNRQSEPTAILDPVREAEHVVANFGYFAPAGSDQLGGIIGAIRVGQERGYRRIGAITAGEAIPALSVSRQRVADKHVTLGDAVDKFIEDRKPSAKLVAELRLALRQFKEAIGHKTLSSITRDDVRLFVETLAEKRVGDRSFDGVPRFLSEQSISKRVRLLSSTVNHVRDRILYDGDNPFADFNVKAFVRPIDRALMPAKRRFTITEMDLIFNDRLFIGTRLGVDNTMQDASIIGGAAYWGPVVAALTGCRAAELGGMKLDEVRESDRHPHLLVRPNEHRGTKNGRSRAVPILDALMDLGFAQYVARIRQQRATRLFPDWTARPVAGGKEPNYPAWSNAGVIRAFNRTIIPAALAGLLAEGARREVTFHAFRGAYKNMLATTYNLPINVVNEVVGHAKSELDSRYIGNLSIEETYPLVHNCRYAELNIPMLIYPNNKSNSPRGAVDRLKTLPIK